MKNGASGVLASLVLTNMHTEVPPLCSDGPNFPITRCHVSAQLTCCHGPTPNMAKSRNWSFWRGVRHLAASATVRRAGDTAGEEAFLSRLGRCKIDNTLVPPLRQKSSSRVTSSPLPTPKTLSLGAPQWRNVRLKSH